MIGTLYRESLGSVSYLMVWCIAAHSELEELFLGVVEETASYIAVFYCEVASLGVGI